MRRSPDPGPDIGAPTRSTRPRRPPGPPRVDSPRRPRWRLADLAPRSVRRCSPASRRRWRPAAGGWSNTAGGRFEQIRRDHLPRLGVVAEHRPPAVHEPLAVQRKGVVPLGFGGSAPLVVVGDRTRLVQHPPAGRAYPQREVDVLVVRRVERLVEPTDLVERTTAYECGGAGTVVDVPADPERRIGVRFFRPT